MRRLMASVLTPLCAVLAALLAGAGAAKLRSPSGAAWAPAGLGRLGGRSGARIVGLGEVALGGWALVAPGRVACLLLGGAYAAFAVYLVRGLRAGADCGCFGPGEAPATRAHLAFDALAAGVAIAAAVHPGPSLLALAARDWPAGIPLALGVGCAAYLSYLVLAVLPPLWHAGAAREP